MTKMTTKTLKERITEDYLKAFKARDTDRKNLLGVIKGEIQNEELRTGKDADVEAILKKMEKSLKQTNSLQSLLEIEYIKDYLPEMMEEKLIRSIIQSYVNTGMDNMGQLMGAFNKEYKGKADNNLVSAVIKEILL